MADSKQAWQEATSQILAKLDVVQTYRELGLDVTGHKPSAKGWLEARAYGVEDRTPSAGIHVGDGPLRGRYKDFRTGESLTLYDFAAKVKGCDWREARKHYAHAAGVELPSGDENLVADKFEFSTITAGTLLLYSKGKPGISATALSELGCWQARWPRKLPPDKQNHLIACPMYGASLLDLEPTGWHCVAQHPRGKIRQFQGKGHEDRLLDKMTAGEYGLMNVDGIKRLAEADVVHIVEGFTDLAACQTVISPWREADPDNRKHVVLSAGACTYHPRAEWMPHFAGKKVCLWFDVGDTKDEGQVAAKVWVNTLLPVAEEVRNVQLPLGPEGGKNDLRAWLVGDVAAGRSPHNFQDMLDYAATFEPIDQTDTAAQIKPHEALLANLGIKVIGEHEGLQKIEVFSEPTNKSCTISEIDRLSYAKLLQLIGPERAEKFVHDGRECPPEKYELKAVRNAIAATASDKVFYEGERFGAGVWEAQDKLILVKSREVAILNGTGQLERSNVPFIDGRILDCGRNSGEWYDLPKLNQYLAEARNHEWCLKTIEEARQIFAQWNWRHPVHAPAIVVGLVIASWIQSLWRWRPLIFVCGGSNTGKTVLLQDTISGGIFGSLGMFVEKPTEAAISQHMRHHGKVLCIDEFEKCQHRQRILELLRTSSRGGVKIRGTADQRGIEFRLRHISWLASIETGLLREADRNRYIILELDEIPPEKRKGFRVPPKDQLNDLGARLLAIGLTHHQAARRLATLLQSIEIADVPSRIAESFAVPIGVLAAALGADDAAATDLATKILTEWDFTSQSSSDHVDLLMKILTSSVNVDHAERKNISTLLTELRNPDSTKAMNRIGVKGVRKRGRPIDDPYDCLWVCPETACREVLRGTEYEDMKIDELLMRLPGAKRTQQRMGGEERFRGIEIPMEAIWKIFNSAEDDATTDPDDF